MSGDVLRYKLWYKLYDVLYYVLGDRMGQCVSYMEQLVVVYLEIELENGQCLWYVE